MEQKPNPSDFTFNGVLQQPHYDNTVRAWEKMERMEEAEEKVPVVGYILFSIAFLLLIGCFSIIVDKTVFNSKYYNKIAYGSDCSYTVPSGYEIKYSNTRKKYAVAVLQFGDYCLYNGSRGITTMFSNIAEPSMFDDTCAAKGYLKAYIKQNEPKF